MRAQANNLVCAVVAIRVHSRAHDVARQAIKDEIVHLDGQFCWAQVLVIPEPRQQNGAPYFGFDATLHRNCASPHSSSGRQRHCLPTEQKYHESGFRQREGHREGWRARSDVDEHRRRNQATRLRQPAKLRVAALSVERSYRKMARGGCSPRDLAMRSKRAELAAPEFDLGGCG